jgi:MFS superfamily sulfate permease-like transporter
LLHNLPNVVLAAIVLVAVKGLIDLRELRHLWRASRFEFTVSMTAFAGVLLLGTLKGVMLAAVTSLLLLIRRAARPHVAFVERNDVLLFRIDASLLYFNAENVHEVVWARLRSTATMVRLVVCDLSSSPHVDLAGARILSRLHRELRAVTIDFRLTGANGSARDVMRAEAPAIDILDEFERGAPDGAPRRAQQSGRLALLVIAVAPAWPPRSWALST